MNILPVSAELDLPITVEDYAQQVQTLVKKTFPEAKLMPGEKRLIGFTCIIVACPDGKFPKGW